MSNSIKNLLENLDRLDSAPAKQSNNTLADNLLAEWNEFQLIAEAPPVPGQPVGTATTQPTAAKTPVDTKTVTTLAQLKTATAKGSLGATARRIVPSVAANALQKQAQGQPLTPQDRTQLTTLNATIGQAASGALLNPRTGNQTLSAIRSTEQAKAQAQARAQAQQRQQK